MSTVLPSRPLGPASRPAGPAPRPVAAPRGRPSSRPGPRRDRTPTRRGDERTTLTTAVPSVPPAARVRRDPFVDGARTIGILLVVALHWVMVEATWDGRSLVVGNALSHGWAWLLTWLQPLPLLFFAAGAAARYDLVRHPGQPGWRFAGVRLLRMLRPVAVFAGTWVVLVAALPRLGVPEAAVERVARIVPQPLWFLAVQLGLLALTPAFLRLLRRFGAGPVLVVGALLPVAVDLLRFSDELPVPGWPNILLVWAVPFVGGLVYADRRARPEHRDVAAGERATLGALAVGGLAATVLLLSVGPYPWSLIGMPGDAISNLAPPTAPVVGFAVAQVALVLLCRDVVVRWAERSRVVRWAGPRSMGLYLWHLTAMFAVSGVVLLGLGETLPAPWTWDWWTTRAGYLGAAALVLAGIVAVAARLERGPVRRPAQRIIAGTEAATSQPTRASSPTTVQDSGRRQGPGTSSAMSVIR